MAFRRILARLPVLSLLVAVGASLQVGCSSEVVRDTSGTSGTSTSTASTGSSSGSSGTSTSTSSNSSSSSSSGTTSSSDDLRVCALLAGCSGLVGAGMTGWCEPVVEIEVGGNMSNRSDSLSLETLQCVGNATTCAEVNACQTATPAEAAACAGASELACSGDVLLKCSFGTPLVFYDCAQDGQHCFQGAGDAACGTGACDPSATAASCQGDVLVTCTDIGTAAQPSGVLVPTDCKKQHGWTAISGDGDGCSGPSTCLPLYADTCGVANGVAQCMGTGAACDPSTYASSCSGSVVTACTGGKVATFDCASLGPLVCDTQDFTECVSPTTECSDYGPDTCNDGVITFCLFGTTTTIDCKSYGFSGCTTMQVIGQGTAAICAM
jgi:hypothetical protein